MKTYFAGVVLALSATAPGSAQMFGDRDGLSGFENADANHDGVVMRAEFAAARIAHFDKMDRNGDGVVTKGDFSRLARFRPQAMERIDMLIAQSDANKDGRLTRAELNAAPMPVFDRVDSNRNGAVDKAELARARDTMQERGN